MAVFAVPKAVFAVLKAVFAVFADLRVNEEERQPQPSFHIRHAFNIKYLQNRTIFIKTFTLKMLFIKLKLDLLKIMFVWL